MSPEIRLVAFETPIGCCGFAHIDQVLQRFRVGYESTDACWDSFEAGTKIISPDDWEARLAERIVASLQPAVDAKAVHDNFLDVSIADENLTPFQKKVSDACRRIEFGQTLSYGALAESVGHPGAARAVGSVMSRNRYPLIVPCHRVLGAGGLGGYTSPEGVGTKRQLLEIEGYKIKTREVTPSLF